LQSDAVRSALFAATALCLCASYVFCRWLLATRFGSVVVALRDAESRVRFLGYPVAGFKLAVFVLSAMLAGLAGALYVPQVGIINPGEFQPLNSIEIAIWVAVGGRGTLHGAMLGALLIAAAETMLTARLPEVWLFALGSLFLLVTLFLPRGVAGLLQGRAG
jgi:urea transport system permease protein